MIRLKMSILKLSMHLLATKKTHNQADMCRRRSKSEKRPVNSHEIVMLQ